MSIELQERIRTAGAAAPPVRGKPGAQDRLISLDAYRGFVMLAMVSAGLGMAHLLGDRTWGWLADQMRHRDWEGCTFWDLIQPSFMFIVGASMPFAFAQRQKRGDTWWRQFGHAVRRSLTLIAIGVFLDTYAEQVFYVQFIRVLQQIAIGYLLAFLVLQRGPLEQAAFAVVLLILHPLAYVFYGWAIGADPWYACHNIGVEIDLFLHLPLSRGNYVTLNAISSTATILFGVLCGELLRSDWSARRKLLTLVAAGLAGLALGMALTPVVPLVKKIWTTSFTLLAAGWTCLLMAVFYGLIDVLHYRRWAFPFVVVGMNSIAVYVVAGVFGSNIRQAVRAFLGQPLSAVPLAAPVITAVLVTLVQWLFCYWLYRRKIFFKV
jgi:heparan-alpha-glucosaminide N-acetyltransferase